MAEFVEELEEREIGWRDRIERIKAQRATQARNQGKQSLTARAANTRGNEGEGNPSYTRPNSNRGGNSPFFQQNNNDRNRRPNQAQQNANANSPRYTVSWKNNQTQSNRQNGQNESTGNQGGKGYGNQNQSGKYSKVQGDTGLGTHPTRCR